MTLVQTVQFVVGALPLCAATIDYRFVGLVDRQTTTFTAEGVTVTGGPGLVFVNISNGLSIIGVNNSAVDPGEFLNFTFDEGAATDISFRVNSIIKSLARLDAIGIGGALGSHVVSLSNGTTDVSSMFGNQPIAHFTLTAMTEAYRLDALTFTPGTSVLEPSSFVLSSSALAVIIAAQWIRRGRFRTHNARPKIALMTTDQPMFGASQKPGAMGLVRQLPNY